LKPQANKEKKPIYSTVFKLQANLDADLLHLCAYIHYIHMHDLLRKIPPDCVLYSKYILSKSLAEFSPHLRYFKYSRSKRQSCLLYLQILFTAFPTYAAVYFQFVAHTLVHSDKADPASSSRSPWRYSCSVWL